MSSADAQIAYQRGGSLEPVQAQTNFTQQFDLSQPEQAMSSYQKLLHQHTKQQFQMATSSSRRRSTKSEEDVASLSSERSTGSVSSTAS